MDIPPFFRLCRPNCSRKGAGYTATCSRFNLIIILHIHTSSRLLMLDCQLILLQLLRLPQHGDFLLRILKFSCILRSSTDQEVQLFDKEVFCLSISACTTLIDYLQDIPRKMFRHCCRSPRLTLPEVSGLRPPWPLRPGFRLSPSPRVQLAE